MYEAGTDTGYGKDCRKMHGSRAAEAVSDCDGSEKRFSGTAVFRQAAFFQGIQEKKAVRSPTDGKAGLADRESDDRSFGGRASALWIVCRSFLHTGKRAGGTAACHCI